MQPADAHDGREPRGPTLTALVGWLAAANHMSGFSDRYGLLLRAIAERCELEVILVGDAGLAASPSWWRTGRGVRFRMALRGLLAPVRTMGKWEQAVQRRLRGTDLCLALVHPYFTFAHLAVAIGIPTILFAEEKVEPHRAPEASDGGGERPSRLQSAGERLSRRLQRGADVVVVIGPNEVAWATSAFPRSRVEVVPHIIDVEYWSTNPELSVPKPLPTDVLVVALLSSPRTAGDLRRILAELERVDPDHVVRSVTLVSGHPPHEELGDLPPRVRLLRDVADVRPHYESTTAVLVPPFHLRGTKTTILQAWAARRPVVTTDACAASLGLAASTGALACGATPIDVARQLVRVVADVDRRVSLVDQGWARLQGVHSATAAVDHVLMLVDEVMANQAAPSR